MWIAVEKGRADLAVSVWLREEIQSRQWTERRRLDSLLGACTNTLPSFPDKGYAEAPLRMAG